MEQIDFIQALNKSTKRDYVGRVTEFPKAEAAKIARYRPGILGRGPEVRVWGVSL